MDTRTWAQQIIQGDRRALAKAITLMEDLRPEMEPDMFGLLRELKTQKPASLVRRIGISGAGGAGKSTFIESFGLRLIHSGERVGVLTIDPSSPVTGGSLLADKTRMTHLSNHPQAFVRPSPSGQSVDGLSLQTRNVLQIMEFAGFDTLILESVGAGQAQYAIGDAVDMLITLFSPHNGDDLQAMKKGLLETTDLVLVNKADGELQQAAHLTKTQLEQSLSLSEASKKVLLCSGKTGFGLDQVVAHVDEFFESAAATGALARGRRKMLETWYRDCAAIELMKLIEPGGALHEHWRASLNTASDSPFPPELARSWVSQLWKWLPRSPDS